MGPSAIKLRLLCLMFSPCLDFSARRDHSIAESDSATVVVYSDGKVTYLPAVLYETLWVFAEALSLLHSSGLMAVVLGLLVGYETWPPKGFRSRFSQCVDYMRFNEKSFCFRWQETTKLMLFFNTKTSSLVVLCDLRYLTGNISSVMTKHMGVQRRLHRFAYLIVQIILWFYS